MGKPKPKPSLYLVPLPEKTRIVDRRVVLVEALTLLTLFCEVGQGDGYTGKDLTS